jgi:hypothetical protein
MSLLESIRYLALWSLIGATLFSLFVIFVFRSGVVYASRKDDGTLKEKIPLRGYMVIISFLLIIIGFLVLANTLSLARHSARLGIGPLFLLNLALYLILFVFDTLVIDGFVLSYWRPGFLRLADELGRESMREHINRSILVGLSFGVIIAGLSTLISYVVLLR